MKTKIIYVIFCSLLPILLTSASKAEERPAYQLPVLEFKPDAQGFLVNVSDQAYLEYMWDSFVAINWPASPIQRGKPNTKLTQPASRHPVVWETYATAAEVFLPSDKWYNYPNWNQLQPKPAGLSLQQASALCEGFDATQDIILYDINQPNVNIRDGAVAPLIDQHRRYVRYQVAMNQPFFEYFRKQRYFSAEEQIKAVRISQQAQFAQRSKPPPGAFVGPPIDQDGEPGMLEIKSAWRVLDPQFDKPERYYARPGYILSPNRQQCERTPAGLGLVALHIHRRTQLSHTASTFEQIDNVAILDPATAKGVRPSLNPGVVNPSQSNIWPPYGNIGFQGKLPPLITEKSKLAPRERRQPNNISRATSIPESVRIVNRQYQQRYDATPLKYYQIVNAQHVRSDCRMKPNNNFTQGPIWEPSNCPKPNTGTLINTALESYTQLVNPFTHQDYNYSCQDCHAHARPCGFAGVSKPELSFKPEFMVMSYLLSKAKFTGQTSAPDNYSCNNPETQTPQP